MHTLSTAIPNFSTRSHTPKSSHLTTLTLTSLNYAGKRNFFTVSGRWEAMSMSIAELPNRGNNNSNNRVPATIEFERTPPQDLIAVTRRAWWHVA